MLRIRPWRPAAPLTGVAVLLAVLVAHAGAGAPASALTRLAPVSAARTPSARVASREAHGPPAAPGARLHPPRPQALQPLSAGAPQPTAAGLAAVLDPLLGAQALAGSAGVAVVDAATGHLLLSAGGPRAREPASVAKLFTAAALLHQRGPEARLTTRTVLGVLPGRVVLVGGGDQLLSAGAGHPGAVDGHAGLADLADATATALRARGASTASVALDDSLTGSAPALDPTWAPSDVGNGYVAPLTSLAVDGGRLHPTKYSVRTPDPAMAAATTFAALLAQRGITVTGPVVRTSGPVAASAVQLAAVSSAPLGDVLAWTLAQSDNTVAEALARLVGAAVGAPPTFAASAAAVLAVDARDGVDVAGAHLVDGSGLGAGSFVPPLDLAELLATAAGPGHADLRPLLAELPVGGLSGTLADRFAPGSREDAGAGVVRAKTGTLTGVDSLAGTLVDADGRQLAFAVLADRVGATAPSRAAVDAVPDALVGCGCR